MINRSVNWLGLALFLTVVLVAVSTLEGQDVASPDQPGLFPPIDETLIARIASARDKEAFTPPYHRSAGRIKGLAQRGNTLSFGTFGLKALEPVWLTSRQIEAARIAATRYMKRQGQLWIKIFPDKPITKKPAEVRMGKGKGNPEYWAAPIRPGRILFEVDGVPEEVAREALRLAANKLPMKTKFIIRRDLQTA